MKDKKTGKHHKLHTYKTIPGFMLALGRLHSNHKPTLKLISQYVTSSWEILALFLRYMKFQSNLNQFIRRKNTQYA